MAPIYVEIEISCAIEDLWEKTQTPELHQRWDLRFTDIKYLPRTDPSQPQRFMYQTRIGFGLKIVGEGETIAGPKGDSKTSVLKFWSEDSKSLIKEGAGYWQYAPVSPYNIRFLTQYDYSTRFGALGRLFDGVLFRRLMGWATAWSFDRLRLWIEKGIDPQTALQRSLVHAISRFTVAFVWIYHGLVPKILIQDHQEISMLRAAGISAEYLPGILLGIGIVEVILGVVMLIGWRHRFMFIVTAVAMVVSLLVVATRSPEYLVAAFNPVTLNLGVIALCVIGGMVGEDLPSASRCKRGKTRQG